MGLQHKIDGPGFICYNQRTGEVGVSWIIKLPTVGDDLRKVSRANREDDFFDKNDFLFFKFIVLDIKFKLILLDHV
jgi:hypothetical protein